MAWDSEKVVWIFLTLALIVAGGSLILVAASRKPGRRVGLLSLACFLIGLALCGVSVFLSQQKASADLLAERAKECASATDEKPTTLDCGAIVPQKSTPTTQELLEYQENQKAAAARRDRAAGLFGDAGKVLIGIGIADAFAKRLLDLWKSDPLTSDDDDEPLEDDNVDEMAGSD